MRLLTLPALVGVLVTASNVTFFGAPRYSLGDTLPNRNAHGDILIAQDLDSSVKKPACGGGSSANARSIAYYQEWNIRTRPCDKVRPSQIKLDGLSQLNLAFAYIDPLSFKLRLQNPQDDEIYRQFVDLKQRGIKVWLGVGGWEFSDEGPTRTTWSDIASSAANRKTFIKSTMEFLKEYGFDGLDIDWEWPTSASRGGRPDDTQNQVTLFKELRNSLGKEYGLTCVLPHDNTFLQGIDIKSLSAYVDWFNVLTYDLHGSWDGNNPSIGSKMLPHTDLKEIDNHLEALWATGVDPSKFTLGLAYYGRGYTTSDSNCSHDGCPFSGPSIAGNCSTQAGVLSGCEIKRIIKEKALTPSIIEGGASAMQITWDNQWISYDDGQTLAMKKDFASERCMGGTAVWAIDYDSCDNDGHLPPVGPGQPSASSTVPFIISATSPAHSEQSSGIAPSVSKSSSSLSSPMGSSSVPLPAASTSLEIIPTRSIASSTTSDSTSFSSQLSTESKPSTASPMPPSKSKISTPGVPSSSESEIESMSSSKVATTSMVPSASESRIKSTPSSIFPTTSEVSSSSKSQVQTSPSSIIVTTSEGSSTSNSRIHSMTPSVITATSEVTSLPVPLTPPSGIATTSKITSSSKSSIQSWASSITATTTGVSSISVSETQTMSSSFIATTSEISLTSKSRIPSSSSSNTAITSEISSSSKSSNQSSPSFTVTTTGASSSSVSEIQTIPSSFIATTSGVSSNSKSRIPSSSSSTIATTSVISSSSESQIRSTNSFETTSTRSSLPVLSPSVGTTSVLLSSSNSLSSASTNIGSTSLWLSSNPSASSLSSVTDNKTSTSFGGSRSPSTATRTSSLSGASSVSSIPTIAPQSSSTKLDSSSGVHTSSSMTWFTPSVTFMHTSTPSAIVSSKPPSITPIPVTACTKDCDSNTTDHPKPTHTSSTDDSDSDDEFVVVPWLIVPKGEPKGQCPPDSPRAKQGKQTRGFFGCGCGWSGLDKGPGCPKPPSCLLDVKCWAKWLIDILWWRITPCGQLFQCDPCKWVGCPAIHPEIPCGIIGCDGYCHSEHGCDDNCPEEVCGTCIAKGNCPGIKPGPPPDGKNHPTNPTETPKTTRKPDCMPKDYVTATEVFSVCVKKVLPVSVAVNSSSLTTLTTCTGQSMTLGGCPPIQGFTTTDWETMTETESCSVSSTVYSTFSSCLVSTDSIGGTRTSSCMSTVSPIVGCDVTGGATKTVSTTGKLGGCTLAPLIWGENEGDNTGLPRNFSAMTTGIPIPYLEMMPNATSSGASCPWTPLIIEDDEGDNFRNDTIVIPTLFMKNETGGSCPWSPLNIDDDEGDNFLNDTIAIPTLFMKNETSGDSCPLGPLGIEDDEGDNFFNETISIPLLPMKTSTISIPSLTMKGNATDIGRPVAPTLVHETTTKHPKAPTLSQTAHATPSASATALGMKPIQAGGRWEIKIEHLTSLKDGKPHFHWTLFDPGQNEAGGGNAGNPIQCIGRPPKDCFPFDIEYSVDEGDVNSKVDFEIMMDLPSGRRLKFNDRHDSVDLPEDGYPDEAYGCKDDKRNSAFQDISRTFWCYLQWLGAGGWDGYSNGPVPKDL